MDRFGNHDSIQDSHEDGHYRRIEMITGRRRLRSWSAREKAEIVSQSAEPGANISEVARRWGVNKTLLYAWRREAGVIFPGGASPSFGERPGNRFWSVGLSGESYITNE